MLTKLSSWKSCCSCVSQKWIFTCLASVGLCIAFVYSSFLSITILEMVVKTEGSDIQDNGSCESSNSINLKNKTYIVDDVKGDDASITRYPWDEYTQGIILSSFAWSYTIGRLIYGPLAERFEGKYVVGLGIFLQALITFITPFTLNSVNGGFTALIITRVLVGVGNSLMYPGVITMIYHWTTPADRTTIGNAIYNGPVLGIFFGNIIPALIMEYSDMGWPAVFYFVGILGIIWFPLWLLLVYESPEVHPFISDKELEHLRNNSEEKKCKLPSPPWKQIFMCKEFWAYTIIFTGSNWAIYVMLIGLPRYMGNVVKFSLESNGYFSSLPYIAMWFNSMASAWINEKILEKKWMTLTNLRKLFATLSNMGPAICLMLASYAECDKTVVVIMFFMGITFFGNFLASAMLNPLDLGPNYAASMMAVGEGIGSTIGIAAPYAIGVLTPHSTFNEWRIVFWIVFVFALASNAVYLVWFKAEVQPWNDLNFASSEIESCKIKRKIES